MADAVPTKKPGRLPLRRPLVWAAVSSAAGIAVGLRVPFAPWLLGLALAALALAGLLWRLGRGFWPGLLLAIAVLSLGWASVRTIVPPLPPDGTYTLTGTVATMPRMKEDAATLLLKNAVAMNETGVAIALPGQVWFRYRPEEAEALAALPDIGQQIVATVSLYAPQGARNPGGFDFANYLRGQGAYLAAYSYKPWNFAGPPAGGLLPWVQRNRQALAARLAEVYDEEAPVISGMLIGEKQDLSLENQQAFRRSGVSHLLSVSGLHVAFVAAPLLLLFQKRGWAGWLRMLLLAGVLGAYCLLVGAPASTLRASAMMLVLQGASLAGRRYDSLSGIAASFWAMLLWQPLYLRNTGWTLSFAAVLGMALLGQPCRRLFAFLPSRIGEALAVSLSAQIGTLPLVAAYFGEVPLLGLLANLLTVPMSGVIVLVGLVALALDLIWPPLAFPLAWLVQNVAWLLTAIARLVAAVPFATFRVASPTWYAIIGSLAAMALVSPVLRVPKRIGFSAAAALLVAVFGLSYLTSWQGAQYTQVDVGQGDAAVLRAGGRVIAIDTGSEGASGLADYLRHEGLTLDTLYITHPHEDHTGGLLGLLQAGIPIGRIVLPADFPPEQVDPAAYDALLAAQRQGIPLEGISAGFTESWGEGCTLAALWPPPGVTFKDANDASLVLRLEVAGVSILVTGDITSRAEPLTGVACDVLKVAHHGSRASTAEIFLAAAQPTWAVISVGRNNYGHPTPQVLERLENIGAQVLRTDLGGALMLELDQGTVRPRPFLRNGE